MKKVKCIDNNGASELDLEKQYYVKEENNDFYTISVREGKTANYLKRRFEVAEITFELDIIEASNMPLGTEFQILYPNGYIDNLKCKVSKSGSGNMLSWIHNEESIGGTQSIINAKFMPVKQKPVSFMEAISNPNNKIRILLNKDNFFNSDIERFNNYMKIQEMFKELAKHFGDIGISKAICDGEFYIEK